MKTNRPFFAFKDISLLYHPLALFAFSLLLVFVFFATNPKYSASLFPFKRTRMVSSFIASTKKQGEINPREFWALREFYAPGIITVNKTATATPFLVFRSGKITSYESLVPAAAAQAKVALAIPGNEVYFRSNTEAIYRENGAVHIIFLKPINEMVTANSVYDYKDKDKKFLEGKMWFVNTVIDTR